MTGETVGSYRLAEKLGEGGMGEVYAAEHKYIQRRAAIKFLLPELTGSSDLVKRFFDEARAASMIKHRGIVEVFDCDVHPDGRAYIVMELLNGESLRDYLERIGKIDGDEAGALGICAQMSGALVAAHAQGIIHRDLKPDNAFLHLPPGASPAEPVVKLLDFGIAKLQGGGETGVKTRTGQLLGTPMYMSPEQCRGARQIDGRSDIYAFGCIMYEIFCGRPPFIDEGFGDLIVAHISHPPPEPLEFAPAMTPEMREIILRCLAKQPEMRPASMTEVGTMLATAGGRETTRLGRPVALATRPGRAVARPATPRSPVGWGSSPDRVATTPFPQSPHSGARTPAAARQRGPHTPPQIGGTKVLPTPAPTTLSGGASEILTPAARNGSGGKKWAVIAAAMLGAGGIAALALNGAPSMTDKTKSAASLPASVETPAPIRTPDPENRLLGLAHAEGNPTPAESSIRLLGVPAGATVSLDGQPASLPLVVRRNAASHRLVVEADGFERWESAIDGGSDQVVTVRLKPKRTETHAPTKIKHKSEHAHGSPGFSGFDDL